MGAYVVQKIRSRCWVMRTNDGKTQQGQKDDIGQSHGIMLPTSAGGGLRWRSYSTICQSSARASLQLGAQVLTVPSTPFRAR